MKLFNKIITSIVAWVVLTSSWLFNLVSASWSKNWGVDITQTTNNKIFSSWVHHWLFYWFVKLEDAPALWKKFFSEDAHQFYITRTKILDIKDKKWCTYTNSWTMKVYWEWCEPDYDNITSFWSPAPFLINAQEGNKARWTLKDERKAIYENWENIAYIQHWLNKTNDKQWITAIKYEPTIDDNKISVVNWEFNNFWVAVRLKDEDLKWKWVTNPQTEKDNRYDANGSTPMQDFSSWRSMVITKNWTSRPLEWIKLNFKDVNTASWWLYWKPIEKFETSNDNPKHSIVWLNNWKWKGCKWKTPEWEIRWNWNWCFWEETVNGAVEAHTDGAKIFKFSYYSNIQDKVNQANRWVYMRVNWLIDYSSDSLWFHNWVLAWTEKDPNNRTRKTTHMLNWAFSFETFSANSVHRRYAIVQQSTFTIKSIEKLRALIASFRPEVVFALNYLSFEWVWYNPTTNQSGYSIKLSPATIKWWRTTTSAARTIQRRSIGEYRADDNWFKSSQFYNGWAGLYKLSPSAIGTGTQLNAVFLNDATKWGGTVTVPFENDNRYTYFWDIGFCWDGITQKEFGEKCDGEGCDKYCQKEEPNFCGNGVIDEIWSYINKQNKEIKIYEQCDPWMFEKDNLNQHMDSSKAGGKMTGKNNPCYSNAEIAQAQKYGLTSCNWKVPEAVMEVERDNEGNLSDLKTDAKVSVKDYPAWTSPKDIRLYQYLFKKNPTTKEIMKIEEMARLKALSWKEKMKEYTSAQGAVQKNIKEQTMLKESFDEKLCKVIKENEDRVKDVYSKPEFVNQLVPKDPLPSWMTEWHYRDEFGKIIPKFSAPFFKKVSTAVPDVTSFMVSDIGKNNKIIILEWIQNVFKEAIKDNKPKIDFYRFTAKPEDIGIGKNEATINENTELSDPWNDITFQGSCNPTPQGVKPTHFFQNMIDYYSDKKRSDYIHQKLHLDPEKFGLEPVYWSMLYNNVALAYGFQVYNIVTELDWIGDQPVRTLMKCNPKEIKVNPTTWNQVEIDFDKVYTINNGNKGLNVIKQLKDPKSLVCAWIKEKWATNYHSLLGGTISQSLKDAKGNSFTVNCLKGEDYVQKALQKQLKVNFTRSTDASWQLKPWTVSITAIIENKENNTLEQKPTCHANLNGDITQNNCDEKNFVVGYQKPNKTGLINGNVGNLIGIGSF